MEIIWLLVGVLFGALGTALFLNARNRSKVSQQVYSELEQRFQSATAEAIRLAEANRLFQQRFEDAEKLLQKEYDNSELSAAKVATAEAEKKALLDKLAEQQLEIENLHKKLTEQFENIASRIVNNNTKMMQEQQSMRLDQILNPLKEKIEKFENKVDQTHKESIRENQSLKEQLANLATLNQTIGEEAKNLTSALKGQSKVQGNWGEYILESILEKSGLVKGSQYEMQVSHTTEDGRRVQPDVIINLPDSKHLVVDAKVSLIAYEKYCSAETEQERALYFAEHVASVKKHIKDLGSKNYQQLYKLRSLDFVVMFVPIEPAFSAVVQADLNLFNEAYEKNIVLVSPSTLLATVRTVASIWRQEYQNRNSLDIARQSGELYDKFVNFVVDMEDIGKRISSTHASYEGAMTKLKGRGGLISKSQKIKEMGANTRKIMIKRARQPICPAQFATTSGVFLFSFNASKKGKLKFCFNPFAPFLCCHIHIVA